MDCQSTNAGLLVHTFHHFDLAAPAQAVVLSQRRQWGEEWRELEQGGAPAGELPPFMAGGGKGRHKRCRPAPHGHQLPRLHRLALLAPTPRSQVQQGAQQRRHVLQATVAGGGAAAAAAGAAGGAAAAGAAAADVTLVTQLSLDRLPALERQCQGWAGPIAAVVYAPLVGGRLLLEEELEGVGGVEGGGHRAAGARMNGSTPLAALEHVRAFAARVAQQGGCTRRGAGGCGGA